VIEGVLAALDGGRPVPVAGAGRTDAGVHALGQVASFTLAREIGADTLRRALNAHLPPAIRVLSAEDVPPSFHARFDARAKTYRYQFSIGEVLSPFDRGRVWHVAGDLDIEAMRAAAQRFHGRHDFAAFQGTGADVATTAREIFVSRIVDCGLRTGEESATESATAPATESAPESAIESAIHNPQSALMYYEVTGNGFLRHMVRTMAGTLVEVGRGRRPVAWIDEVIASRDRTRAGQTAPAQGLFLVSVDYPPALAAGS
jgi:tRNA pseudouridine38-40 synthase